MNGSLRWIPLAVIAMAACGGKKPTVTPPADPAVDAAPAARVPPTHADPVDGGPPAAGPAPVSGAECDRLVDHVVELARTRHARGVDSSVAPTNDQVATIREGLRAELRPRCLKMLRPAFECALAAVDAEAFEACYAAPHEGEPPG